MRRYRMAVKTVWPVEHACGHEQDHDLSEKRPSERARYARWLKRKDCSDCWRAGRDQANAEEREAWLAEQRATEATEIEAWERACAMPPLDGSDKAVGWGGRVRHQLLVAAHDHASGIGITDNDFAEQVETPARRITSASWWIDQRDTTAEDVAELVQDGAATAVSSARAENPY
jgi:hypothetical protein